MVARSTVSSSVTKRSISAGFGRSRWVRTGKGNPLGDERRDRVDRPPAREEPQGAAAGGVHQRGQLARSRLVELRGAGLGEVECAVEEPVDAVVERAVEVVPVVRAGGQAEALGQRLGEGRRGQNGGPLGPQALAQEGTDVEGRAPQDGLVGPALHPGHHVVGHRQQGLDLVHEGAEADQEPKAGR
jgi:hypothetical protein